MHLYFKKILLHFKCIVLSLPFLQITQLYSENIPAEVTAVIDAGRDEKDLFNHPCGLSINPSGQLFLTDTGNNRVLKFDRHGNLLEETGGFGWNSEQFDHPTGINASNGLDVFEVYLYFLSGLRR